MLHVGQQHVNIANDNTACTAMELQVLEQPDLEYTWVNGLAVLQDFDGQKE